MKGDRHDQGIIGYIEFRAWKFRRHLAQSFPHRYLAVVPEAVNRIEKCVLIAAHCAGQLKGRFGPYAVSAEVASSVCT